MTTIVDLATAVINKRIFELRYDFGAVFYDRRGHICNAILNHADGWEVGKSSEDHIGLTRSEDNLEFSFGREKCDLSQMQSLDKSELMGALEFGQVADSLYDEISVPLRLETFSRIGYRCFYLFETSDRPEAFDRINRLRYFDSTSILPNDPTAPVEPHIRFTLPLPSHALRVSISAFGQSVLLPPSIYVAARKKARSMNRRQRETFLDSLRAKRMIDSFPKFGVMVDLDSFVEDPEMGKAMSPSSFIMDATATAESLIPEILRDG